MSQLISISTLQMTKEQYELFDRLKRDREDNAKTLEKPSMRGVKQSVTDKYSEKAHFVYELLQNADDAEATQCRFVLNNEGLIFAHNGGIHFSISDPDSQEEDRAKIEGKLGHINSITSIANSTKAEADIGKFGLGFKSVFQYTNTPHIYDQPFFFKIERFLVPVLLEKDHPQRKPGETLFYFPFQGVSGKAPATAYKEIAERLDGLENPLLFLRHLREIAWNVGNRSGFYLKEQKKENDCRVITLATDVKEKGSENTFIVFDRDVSNPEQDAEYKISIAYPCILDKNIRISYAHKYPAYCFFATRETTELRFIINAPFKLTDNRENIKQDHDWNIYLRDQLAKLVVESLSAIRDQGMLTVGFLCVLPNPQDTLPPLYEPIRKAIVKAFQENNLTPMKRGDHAAANGIFRGPARISEVIDDEDLILLLDTDDYVLPMWSANPPQQNQQEDRFLDSLDIDEWGWGELANSISNLDGEERECLEGWISQKDDAWLMRFYALLGEACDIHDESVNVSDFSIVRVATDQGNEHVIPSEAFFQPEDGTTLPPDIRFVKSSVYSTGRSEAQKKFATSFLENIGVRPFDAKAIIERKLTGYELAPEGIDKSYFKDIKQFIAYWKKNPTEANLFSSHTFLLDSEMEWRDASELCLDTPYLETGLAGLAKIHGKEAIWDGYQDKLNESQLKDFIAFLKAIGVMHELKVEIAETYYNPHEKVLRQDHWRKKTKTAIDEDYSITYLGEYLAVQSVAASRLIWDALICADAKTAKAHFRPNQDYRNREAESQLVYHLKHHDWIPNKWGGFSGASYMTKDELLNDFPYDDRNGLLTAIGFGENAKRRSDEYLSRNQKAQEIGFESVEEAEEIARLMHENGWSVSDIRTFASQHHDTEQSDNSFPSSRTPDPEHRKEKARDNATKADEKVYEERPRTVRISANANNTDAKEYLRTEYRNEDRNIICQLCHEKMPFQLNGIDHFERQPFIDNLSKVHRANNIALCPNCSAEFQLTCSTGEGEKKGLILDLDVKLPDDELWIELDMPVHKELRFTQRHLIDLKEAILSEGGTEAEDVDSEEQEDEENEEPSQTYKPLPIPNGKVDKFTDSKGREVLIERNPVKQASPATSVKSTLLKCPYCDYNIRQEKYQTHIKEKCPKRPAITGLSHTTQQPLRSAIPRCRFCDSPAIAGSDVCYSCGG